MTVDEDIADLLREREEKLKPKLECVRYITCKEFLLLVQIKYPDDIKNGQEYYIQPDKDGYKICRAQ